MNNNNKNNKHTKSKINNIHDVSEEISKELMNSDLSDILMNSKISKELMNIDNKQPPLNKSRNKITSATDSVDSNDSLNNSLNDSLNESLSSESSEYTESESTQNSSIDNTKIIPTTIKKADNNFFLQELIDNQLKSINSENKLSYSDMKRICKNLKKSIFDKDSNECVLWTGYITNNKNGKQYINFYFKKKKVALHRLLYMNYVGNVNSNEYLKLTCKNSGKCCSIHHIKSANSKQDKNDKTENNTKKNEKSERNNKVITIREKVDIEI